MEANPFEGFHHLLQWFRQGEPDCSDNVKWSRTEVLQSLWTKRRTGYNHLVYCVVNISCAGWKLAVSAARIPLDCVVREAFSSVWIFGLRSDQRWQPVLKIPSDNFLAAQTAAQAVSLVAAELKQLSVSSVDRNGWMMSIPPVGMNGFAIDLNKSENGIRGLFGELEEEFANLAVAMVWLERALSNHYQLKTTLFGGRPREWRLEPTGRHTSSEALATGSGFLPSFFGKKSTIIRSNAFPLK